MSTWAEVDEAARRMAQQQQRCAECGHSEVAHGSTTGCLWCACCHSEHCGCAGCSDWAEALEMNRR